MYILEVGGGELAFRQASPQLGDCLVSRMRARSKCRVEMRLKVPALGFPFSLYARGPLTFPL